MADWVAISSLATAGGTLALAGATYASVKSANRAARAAEGSLLAELRPLIVESFPDDPAQRVNFSDAEGMIVPGGGAAVQVIENRIYIILSLRNVGPGIGVLHGGQVHAERQGASTEHEPLDSFRMLSRDLYIAPGKIGFWQIAYRDRDDPEYYRLLAGIETGWVTADVLYGDFEGGQRVITRYMIRRDDNGEWRVSTIRHWQVDRSDPRGR
jgi:hypothetical protein